MTGATGAPNPVCSNRELLQSQRTMGQHREREQGRVGRTEQAADLYSPSHHVPLFISLFFLSGGKTESPSYLFDCREKYRISRCAPQHGANITHQTWCSTTNTHEGNEESGRTASILTFDMTLHESIDVLDTRLSV